MSAKSLSFPGLTRWGVSPTADLVYRTLVHEGPQSVVELSIQLGLGTRPAQQACEELVAAGAIKGERSDGVRTWRALSACSFVDGLRSRYLSASHARAVQRQKAVTVAGHARVHELTCGGDGFTRLLGAEAVRHRIVGLANGERVEHLAMAPEPVYEADAVSAAAPLDLDLLARGVRLCTLEHVSAAGEAFSAHTGELARHGAEQRILADVPAKMIIYDRQVALVPLDPTDTSLGAAEITVPAVVDSLVAMFLHAWQRAIPHDGSGTSGALSAREVVVVRLLLSDQTDVAIAKQLGMSARTVQYTIRSIMDRLGVNTRFALGHAIGRLGYTFPQGEDLQ